MYNKYGWRYGRGDKRKASRKAEPDTEVRMRSCDLAAATRLWKALAAVLAEGRVRRVGTVSVERVYERPYKIPNPLAFSIN